MSRVVNFPAGTRGDDLIRNLEEVLLYMSEHSDTVRWVNGRAMVHENNHVFISSIEFDSDAECVYACLKFGLI